jgi:hypothetical protein
VSRTLVVDDGRTRRELLVVGTMIVGRDPECEISHSDPRLSRRHAEFSVMTQGVVVRDLKSRNGVRVNGQPVMEAVLQPGDVVQIAHLAVQFLDDGAPVPASGAFRASGSLSAATVSPAVEDDRTRAVSAEQLVSASGRVLPTTAVPRRDLDDDRTRVLATTGGRSSVATLPAGQTQPMPELADLLLRDPTVSPRKQPAVVGAVGIRALMAERWGRRVLIQGMLLAIVVFLITAIPMLAWQEQRFGRHAGEAWAALVPTLLASMAAGLMVSALIVRTTIRGRER